jgi:cyclic-di-GMP phosphodiesterase, flagellum assembly factor TipF
MPQSLVDDTVLQTCAEIVGRDAAIGRQLVLSFRQSAVRAFTKDHWETLGTLSENGLRFAVEELSDLAMDFDVLKTRGFHFVKVDAAALLAGMQAHDGIVSPADACRRFVEAGLSVIVGGVLDDATVAWSWVRPTGREPCSARRALSRISARRRRPPLDCGPSDG